MADPGNPNLEVPVFFEVETERLRLRTAYLSDAKGYAPMMTSPEVMQWTSAGVPITDVDVAEQWIKARVLGRDTFKLSVELKGSLDDSRQPEIIGMMGSDHWPEIGYIFHPGHFNKGYATEALRALVPAAFERMPSAEQGGYDFLLAGTIKGNTVSGRVLEKVGFTECETTLQDFENSFFGKCDSVWYRIARPGKTLEELGVLPGTSSAKDGELPVPPIQ
ncbi:hypothetical protein LTR56_011748 [Elasticomyces elasticus]|nr:hypothetical protein LTR56_011748 [Elasticomyces elasticus]KAK3663282.1 hypothetical protein LTR22_005940 [Elasticomyces elasticus]KAK4929062.1 hypothetical protein LTR49_004259 [Elasticomyces elasticus]KAK5766441.1 hypothetical protein LTS12_003358 [Elasticomyces elasticus]